MTIQSKSQKKCAIWQSLFLQTLKMCKANMQSNTSGKKNTKSILSIVNKFSTSTCTWHRVNNPSSRRTAGPAGYKIPPARSALPFRRRVLGRAHQTPLLRLVFGLLKFPHLATIDIRKLKKQVTAAKRIRRKQVKAAKRNSGSEESLLEYENRASPSKKMLLLWLFALVCTERALCSERYSLPELPPGEAPDPILKFMENMYLTGRAKSGHESGEPLLLTPLIEENKLEEAREAAKVDSDYILPDMDSYAGYLTVNKEYNANLWFWYFPVTDKKVEETPWIIWLQGGPGVSSLYGLFTEIGPFVVNEDNNLEEIKYSWGKNHSLLFIDNPVGTGFSFTSDDRGYATNQTTIGENLYTALQQFLTLFPELRKAPLTIAGESYAGKHIPSVGIQILWNREKDQDRPINLQGLAIGNGFIDPLSLQRYSYFVREIGLVDDNVADFMRYLELAVTQFITNGEMVKAYAYYNYLLNIFLRESKLDNLYNFLQTDVGLGGPHLQYIQRSEVRRALHVGDTNFTSVGVVYRKLVPDFMNSAKAWLEELLENYRVMLYNGHLDIIVAYHPSVNTYNSLAFSGAKDFKTAKRNPWYHNEQLAGYYKTAGNLTEVMILGAGHMVPADKPAPALGLISAFARGVALNGDTGNLIDVEKNSLRRRQLPLQ